MHVPLSHSWHVMISSTMRDLVPEREAANSIIREFGLIPWWAEQPPPEFAGLSPYDFCHEMALRCDLLLLILGPNYGYTPERLPTGGEGRSVTQLEFEWARSENPQKIRVFLRADANNSLDQDQQHFLNQLQHFEVGMVRYPNFNTISDLEMQIRQALSSWMENQGGGRAKLLRMARDRFATHQDLFTGVSTHYEKTIPLQISRKVDEPTVTIRDSVSDERTANQFQRFLAKTNSRTPEKSDLETGNVDDFLERFTRIVLIGDSGTGKTTLLQRHAHDHALDALAGRSERIPLYLSAIDLSEAIAQDRSDGDKTPSLHTAITHYIRTTVGEDAIPAATVAFERGDFCLLIDGFDEIDENQRMYMYQMLSTIGINQTILTTRPQAYLADRLPGWQICQIQQLNPTTRREMIQYLLEEIPQKNVPSSMQDRILHDRKELIDELIEGLKSRQYQSWSNNPFLLSLIVVHYLQIGFLPKERSKIYRLTLDRLIDAPSRLITTKFTRMERDVLEDLLSFLAFRMLEEGLSSVAINDDHDGNDIAHLASFYDEPLSSEERDELIERVAILQPNASNSVGFISANLQEYLAARFLAFAPDSKSVMEFIIQQRLNQRWENVMQLLVNELDRRGKAIQANQVVETLLKADNKRIPLLHARDPIHLALARAIRCYEGRDYGSDRLTRKLRNRWSRATRGDLAVAEYIFPESTEESKIQLESPLKEQSSIKFWKGFRALWDLVFNGTNSKWLFYIIASSAPIAALFSVGALWLSIHIPVVLIFMILFIGLTGIPAVILSFRIQPLFSLVNRWNDLFKDQQNLHKIQEATHILGIEDQLIGILNRTLNDANDSTIAIVLNVTRIFITGVELLVPHFIADWFYPQLKKQLENPSINVQYVAALGFSRLGKSQEDYINESGDEIEEMQDTIDILAKVKHDACNDLILALRTPTVTQPSSMLKENPRAAIAWSLGFYGSTAKPAMKDLEQATLDLDPNVRRAALWSLGELGTLPETQKTIEAALMDTSIEVFMTAVSMLRIRMDQASLPPFDAVMQNTRSSILSQRRIGFAWLSIIGASTPDALSLLHEGLSDNDPCIRWAAASTPWEFSPSSQSLLSDLINSLTDQEPDVRNAVIDAIGNIGAAGKAAIAPLRRLIHKNHYANARFGGITPLLILYFAMMAAIIPGAVNLVSKTYVLWGEGFLFAALLGVMWIGRGLSNDNEHSAALRRRIATALGKIGPEAFHVLVLLRYDMDGRVRRSAALALRTIISSIDGTQE